MNRKHLVTVVLLAIGAALPSIGMGAPLFCSDVADGSATSTPPYTGSLPAPGETLTGLNVSDVTFRGNNADDCYGVVDGNDDVSDINGIGGTFGSGWALGAKDNTDNSSDTSNTVNGINFSLSDQGNNNSGSWTLTWTDVNGAVGANFPAYFDFTVIVKGGTYWAAYLFDDELLQTNPNFGAGTFDIQFLNNSGRNEPGLSHISVYTRYDRPGTGFEPPQLPEPGTLGLLGVAILGGLYFSRRRQFNS